MSVISFDIPIRANSTEYKYGDLVTPFEVYPTPLEIALADMQLVLTPGAASVDFLLAGSLTPYIGGKMAITGNTPVSAYPPAQNTTYVKATTEYSGGYTAPYFATSPLLSLIGNGTSNSWASAAGMVANQRFHIDLGEAKVIKRLYYENYHTSGVATDAGLRHFTLWGSNEASAFAELTYGVDVNWTQLITSAGEFDQHVVQDVSDPQYITITNPVAYRYYAVKIADNWGNTEFMGLRRIELQISDSRKIVGFIGTMSGSTGVTIVSARGGSTRDWLTIDAGFPPASPLGYTCQIENGGHFYRCTTPGVSASSPPQFDYNSGSETIDGAVIWTECTGTGLGLITLPWQPDINPDYGEYRRHVKYAQPKGWSDGGDLYVYDKSAEPRHTRELKWGSRPGSDMLAADLTSLLGFVAVIRGSAYPFDFYDIDGVKHKVILLNSDDLPSAPSFLGFEGDISLELFFVDPALALNELAYYYDGTVIADGSIQI